MITPSQCRRREACSTGRNSPSRMSRTSGVATVRLFESEAKGSRQSALVLLKQAFESAGVEFTDGEQPGVPRSGA